MTRVAYMATDRQTGHVRVQADGEEAEPSAPDAAGAGPPARVRAAAAGWRAPRQELALFQEAAAPPRPPRAPWPSTGLPLAQMALVLELVSGGDRQQLLQRQGCLWRRRCAR